jgi:catalase
MAGKKLTDREFKERVNEAYEQRFNSDTPMRQPEWIQYCHEVYGDKSEQQYCQYFTQARELYDVRWKMKLDKLLVPASNELRNLLTDDDPKVRQRAIDQIMKYTGNDVERKLIKAEVNHINIGFGEE